jgi:hypothetical protein
MTTVYVETHHVIGKTGLVEYGDGLALFIMDPGDTVTGLEGPPQAHHWLKATGAGTLGAYWYLPMDHVLKGGCDLDKLKLNSEVDTGSIDVLLSLESQPAVGTSPAWTTVGTASGTVGSGERKDTLFQFSQGSTVHGCLHSGGHYRYRLLAEQTGKSGNPTLWGLYAMGFVWGAEAGSAALYGSATL